MFLTCSRVLEFLLLFAWMMNLIHQCCTNTSSIFVKQRQHIYHLMKRDRFQLHGLLTVWSEQCLFTLTVLSCCIYCTDDIMSIHQHFTEQLLQVLFVGLSSAGRLKHWRVLLVLTGLNDKVKNKYFKNLLKKQNLHSMFGLNKSNIWVKFSRKCNPFQH